MNWTLSDYANIATIFSIPLTILFWLFTREHVAKFWRTWWKLIFGILTIATLIALWRLGWFKWLSHPIDLPAWILGLLVLLGFLLAFVIWLLANSLTKKSLLKVEIHREKSTTYETIPPAQPTQPDWHNFVSDEIFGVLWRWNYYGNTINESALAAFCPRPGCMNRLIVEFDPHNPNIGRQHYTLPETMICHRCNFKRHFDCDNVTLRQKVINEIERLVNTQQYVQRLK